MHRRSLAFASSGREMSRTFAPPSRDGRARSRPAAAFAHRSQPGSLHHGRRSRALSFNPGALDARSGCGARTQKVRALCPCARAHSGPPRSLERICGGLAQMGLPAVARSRWGRSRCRGHGSPSAWLGAPVCGVRAVALAPDSRADFLLKFFYFLIFDQAPPEEGAQGHASRSARVPCLEAWP